MKATISDFESKEGILWEGEALSASWGDGKGEFVICGDADDQALNALVTSIEEKQRLTIGIEDPELTQVVWRGHVGSAKFDASGSEQVVCSLTMALDDWFGIFPQFSSFYFC